MQEFTCFGTSVKHLKFALNLRIENQQETFVVAKRILQA